jgi:hypothetical protein
MKKIIPYTVFFLIPFVTLTAFAQFEMPVYELTSDYIITYEIDDYDHEDEVLDLESIYDSIRGEKVLYELDWNDWLNSRESWGRWREWKAGRFFDSLRIVQPKKPEPIHKEPAKEVKEPNWDWNIWLESRYPLQNLQSVYVSIRGEKIKDVSKPNPELQPLEALGIVLGSAVGIYLMYLLGRAILEGMADTVVDTMVEWVIPSNVPATSISF